MSISKYQVFLKVVSCGTFTKAAEALNFTQSGISHAITSLESELGITLLSRNRGGVCSTRTPTKSSSRRKTACTRRRP